MIALAVGAAGVTAAPAAARQIDDPVPAKRRAMAPGEDVVVTGQRPATEASGGTKSDTPLAETPQSISVVTSGQIADQGLENLNQALRFVAGITPEQRGAAAEVYDQFALRGFTVPRYLDGLRLFTSPTGYADPQVDVSRIDRYEVVKGPASVLYGQSSPGGLVAISSKLPLMEDGYGAVSGTYGTYDLYRVDADLGGRSGLLAYRLSGSVNGASTQQTWGKRERQTVSGAATLNGDGRTSLTLLAAYSHDPYNGDYSVSPASGTLFANPNGRVSTRFTGSEPGDRFEREQVGLTYIARHDFGGGWAQRTSGRYQHVTSALGIHYVSGFPTDAAQRVVGRASYATKERLDSWTYDNQLTGRLRTGPVAHDLLFGVDRLALHATEDYSFGTATSIDVFAPVYGTTPTIRPGDVAGVPGGTPGSYEPRLRQTGVYGQDQLSLGELRLTASGRYDWTKTQFYGSDKKDGQFTWRVGGLYRLPFGLAPYVSYSTSFEPQLAQVSDDNGATTRGADPTRGRQLELGMKYQVPGTPTLITAAWFRIRQTNVLTTAPLAAFSTQSGEVGSDGFELEASAPFLKAFTGRLAFSTQDVRVTRDATPANVGGRLYGVGRSNLAAFAEWAPKAGPLAGFAIGGDVRHVAGVYAGTGLYTSVAKAGGYTTPAYTLFDAQLRYDLGHATPRLAGWTAQVNAANLFDRRYLTSCYLDYVGWCWYGNRRTVQGTIAYKW